MTLSQSDRSGFARWVREQDAALTQAILDGEPPSWIEQTATGYRIRLGGSVGADVELTPRGLSGGSDA